MAVGARRVIIATEHTLKDGAPKIVRQCQLPLTAAGEVDLIITELAVIEVTREGLLLKEVASGVTPEEVQACTRDSLIIPDTVATIEIELVGRGGTNWCKDEFALESHRRAAEAQREGLFETEIVPVTVDGGKQGSKIFAVDEHMRRIPPWNGWGS